MDFISANNLKLGQFSTLSAFPELFHAVTTRAGGASPVPFTGLNLGAHVGDSQKAIAANYTVLSRTLGFDLQKLITSNQAHGTKIACLDMLPECCEAFPFGHGFSGYDGFITTVPGIVLMIRVADCVPVLLYDPDTKTIGVVHAGWRGTAAGIVKKATALMVEIYGCAPGSILAGIGPAIGPCCYEVGTDVAAAVRRALPDCSGVLKQEEKNRYRLNLQEANRQELMAAGLAPGHIELAGLCTACNLDLFFSHRGEQGKTGRFALMAGLRV